MAIVSAFDPTFALTMTNWSPGALASGGTINIYDATEFEILSGGQIYHAYGSNLTYDVDEGTGVVTILGGTITSMWTFGLGQNYSISDFSKSVAEFFDAFAGDTDHFLSSFLSGDDTINGTAQNDVLFGYTGNDSIFGNGGDDTFIPDAGDDLMDGGAGVNTVSYRDAVSGVTVDLSLAEPQSVGAGLGNDTLVAIQNIEGSDFADVLTGGTGTHVLRGYQGDDIFYAQSGGDYTIWGDSGNDIFYLAGAGIRIANGGDGDDTFYLEGSDTVEVDGGVGNDVFYFGSSLDSSDRVYGY